MRLPQTLATLHSQLPLLSVIICNEWCVIPHFYQSEQGKDIGHIWELGGGTFLSKLIEIPLTSVTIR